MLTTLLLLLSLLAAPTAPTSVRVEGSTITVSVSFEAAERNLGVDVAMTALDDVPKDWAQATVFHHWILDDAGTTQFDDVWERMPTGRYRVTVTLHTDDGTEPLFIDIATVR